VRHCILNAHAAGLPAAPCSIQASTYRWLAALWHICKRFGTHHKLPPTVLRKCVTGGHTMDQQVRAPASWLRTAADLHASLECEC
jgi:hypothetical protein